MHRAHEELCRMAHERLGTDGIVIHMLLGKLKQGDIPAPVRDACIRTMVDNYFPKNTVMITGYGFDMLYAGPREAVLHATFRQNRSEEHTSELQSLMRISYAVFCLKKKNNTKT